jgi:hypothetical protein
MPQRDLNIELGNLLQRARLCSLRVRERDRLQIEIPKKQRRILESQGGVSRVRTSVADDKSGQIKSLNN